MNSDLEYQRNLDAALAASQINGENSNAEFDNVDNDDDLEAAIQASMHNLNDSNEDNTSPNIRQIQPAELLNDIAAQSRTPALRAGFENLARDYPGFRGVRGDGNCYYRGVMYSLIEQLVMHPNRQALFADLAQRFRRLADRRVFNNHYVDSLNRLVALLDNASQNQCWQSIAILEADMGVPDSPSDELLVYGARIMLADAIDVFRASNPDFFAEDYDINDTLTLGTCAEGVGVDAGLLPSALGIHATIELIETNARGNHPLGARTTISPPPQEDYRQLGGPSSASNPLIEVSLLLRPGHFDVIYGDEPFRALNMAALPIPAPLNNDSLPLQPSFFIDMMASPLSKMAATLLLLAGTALMCITLPVISAITYVASACVIAGMVFFAKKALMDDNLEPMNLNHNAAPIR